MLTRFAPAGVRAAVVATFAACSLAVSSQAFAQQSAPSGAQAQRMRELDQKGVLNGDVIDGIMCEEKKEETRVILNSQELGKYFGPEKSPREMKDQILKLLDEWKDRQPELAKPVKKQEQEL